MEFNPLFNNLLDQYCLTLAKIGIEFNELYPDLGYNKITELLIVESFERNKICQSCYHNMTDIIENYKTFQTIEQECCVCCKSQTFIFNVKISIMK